jgi:hypothetical protein
MAINWRRVVRALGWIPWAVVVGVALWFRVTSLGGLPQPDGDQAWFGIQAYHLVSGDPASLVTGTGNTANPVILAIQAPLLLLFGPQFWVLRVPTAIIGVLIVGLAYLWGRHWSDRPTALIAATVLAVTPMAIIVSRGSIESGITPLFALLALHQAFLGRRVGLLLSFLACLIIHPTNLFLAPIMASVYLGRTLPLVERSKWWRVVLEVAVGSAVILTVFGLMALSRSGSAAYYIHPDYRPPHLPTFLAAFPRYLLGQPLFLANPIPRPWIQRFDWLFWGVVVALAVVGVPRLLRQRRWDYLALIGSLAMSLLAFHRMAGAVVLSTVFHRYGAFLLVPTAFALAMLAREVLFTAADGLPTTPTSGSGSRAARARWLPVSLGLVLAAGGLYTLKSRYFDAYNRSGRELLWTLRAEDTTPIHRVYNVISADIDRSNSPGARKVHGIICEDCWVGRPFEFLALGRRDMKVVMYDVLRCQVTPDRFNDFLKRRAEAGDYFVAKSLIKDGLKEHVRTIFPHDRIERWEDVRTPTSAYLVERLQPQQPAEPVIAGAGQGDVSRVR